jgi:hypothetical protein
LDSFEALQGAHEMTTIGFSIQQLFVQSNFVCVHVCVCASAGAHEPELNPRSSMDAHKDRLTQITCSNRHNFKTNLSSTNYITLTAIWYLLVRANTVLRCTVLLPNKTVCSIDDVDVFQIKIIQENEIKKITKVKVE